MKTTHSTKPFRDLEPVDVTPIKADKRAIERVVQMGGIQEWKEMVKSYGADRIRETIQASKQLKVTDKRFGLFFLKSDLLEAP